MIAKVPKIAVPRISARGGLPLRGARAINKVLNGYALSFALHKVVLTSIERAQGAFVTGDAANAIWERRQMLAAAQYATQLGAALERLRHDAQAAVKVLRRAGMNFKLDRAAVVRAQRAVRQNGLPRSLRHLARRFGLGLAEQRSLRRKILTTPVGKRAPILSSSSEALGGYAPSATRPMRFADLPTGSASTH